jgi:hypothetical protein
MGISEEIPIYFLDWKKEKKKSYEHPQFRMILRKKQIILMMTC